jgi:ubiquinone/menaquinone biosynthesis C-methylase UbiE
MKIRSPKNRYDIKINRNHKVLDVGGGQNPHRRANTIIDKFIDVNLHRSGDLKIRKGQNFLHADGEKLPFRDKEFDYVICCHVLEHVENPENFLHELFRVGKKGYLETPSLIGEIISPRASHKWILHEENNKLYLLEKNKNNIKFGYNLGWLFEDYLYKNSLGFKILKKTHPNLFTIRIEWENYFDFEVEPTDPEIKKYFEGEWKEEWADSFFKKRTLFAEFIASSEALLEIFYSVWKSKILNKLFKKFR